MPKMILIDYHFQGYFITKIYFEKLIRGLIRNIEIFFNERALNNFARTSRNANILEFNCQTLEAIF